MPPIKATQARYQTSSHHKNQTTKNYARGTQVTAQDLDDSDFTLVVDKSAYFAFKVDDIEASQSHVNWMSLASDRAALS